MLVRIMEGEKILESYPNTNIQIIFDSKDIDSVTIAFTETKVMKVDFITAYRVLAGVKEDALDSMEVDTKTGLVCLKVKEKYLNQHKEEN
jgi:hypothetical protein